MRLAVLSYMVKSVQELPVSFFKLEQEDEDMFIEQLRNIEAVNGYDVKEILVETIDQGILDFNKDNVVFPRLGIKLHASKIVNDSRYGKIITSTPVDMRFWLDD